MRRPRSPVSLRGLCGNLGIWCKKGDEAHPATVCGGEDGLTREAPFKSHAELCSCEEEMIEPANVCEGEEGKRESICDFWFEGTVNDGDTKAGGGIGNKKLASFVPDSVEYCCEVRRECQGHVHENAKVLVGGIRGDEGYVCGADNKEASELGAEGGSHGGQGGAFPIEGVVVEGTSDSTLFGIEGKASPEAVPLYFVKLYLQVSH